MMLLKGAFNQEGLFMVLCAKVPRKNAEKVRQMLAQKDALDYSYATHRDAEFVYFALKRECGLPSFSKYGANLAQIPLVQRSVHPASLYDALVEKLSEEELQMLVSSFDILGDIAVIEVPAQLEKKEKLIADAILQVHGNVKVVAKKAGATAGEFRIRPVKIIAGEKRTTTLYRENGCEFELDINSVYFSSRLGTERKRVATLAKNGESVLVLFAGVGPFAILIAKTQPNVSAIFAIDSNPAATKYLEESAALNKISDKIIIFTGDASAIVQQYLTMKKPEPVPAQDK